MDGDAFTSTAALSSEPEPEDDAFQSQDIKLNIQVRNSCASECFHLLQRQTNPARIPHMAEEDMKNTVTSSFFPVYNSGKVMELRSNFAPKLT